MLNEFERVYIRAKRSGKFASEAFLNLSVEKNIPEKDIKSSREQAGLRVKTQLIETINALGISENVGLILEKSEPRKDEKGNALWTAKTVLFNTGIVTFDFGSMNADTHTIEAKPLPLEHYPRYIDLAIKAIGEYAEAESARA